MVIVKEQAEIKNLEQWFELAPPKKGRAHWVDGRSALECARAWCGGALGPRVPPELTDLLASHADTRNAVIRSVVPEHRVRFDRLGGEPRNADIVALADHSAGLLAISVEAKADERFDKPVRDVLSHAVRTIAADKRTNAVLRVQQLAAALLPPTASTAVLGDLRYQLLTAVAGALAYAEVTGAVRAVFLVHEFVTDQTSDSSHAANALDLDAFIGRLTGGRVRSLSAGKLIGPFAVPGEPLFRKPAPLYIGKAVRNTRALTGRDGVSPSTGTSRVKPQSDGQPARP